MVITIIQADILWVSTYGSLSKPEKSCCSFYRCVKSIKEII